MDVGSLERVCQAFLEFRAEFRASFAGALGRVLWREPP